MAEIDFSRVKKLNLFEGYYESQLNALLEGATLKKLSHRDVVYRAGDEANSFAVVLDGALKLVKQTASGEDVIVFFASPGDTVATLLMSSEKSVYPVTAVAMGPAQVITIPKRTFNALWTKDQVIMGKINAILFARFSEMQEQKIFVKAPLAIRLARQIVSLIERFSGDSGAVLPIPLTRQEFADAVGSSVESVIRIMSEWSQQGILKTSDRHIEVIRMDRIAEIINGQDKV